MLESKSYLKWCYSQHFIESINYYEEHSIIYRGQKLCVLLVYIMAQSVQLIK
jgi:hypothetical protein